MFPLLALIETYGYLAVFIFTLLEGEVVVSLAGFIAAQGYLSLPTVIGVAILGAIVGDHAFFLFGRYRGKRFIACRPRLEEKVAHVHRLVERYRDAIVIGSRFMYGFRTILPIAIGTSDISLRRFFVLNTIGSVIWGVFFASGGYLFGHVIQQFLGNVRKAEKFIILGVILGVVLTHLILFVRRRIIRRIEKEEERLRREEEGATPPSC